ncbi:MAG: PfkB family carbohydrate kinase [Bacteroidota bacterium]|nr:PfkB family carbohydrate kinase [Bacteroidota bacterium]MDX5431172.1 PfkB family carbohydrate kinase [Bacteroidota bacterium]MDX5469911.1 PfkB family carbohydrate kinase [Bacteroidota bacterium]
MNKWETLFSGFESIKTLVIGDLMVDSYLFGKVDRISPEAPVPVVMLDKRDYRLGGAANVALNLRALGAQVSIASVVGQDEMGDKLGALLRAEGIETEGLIQSSDRRTTVKHRIIGNNHQMLRVDDEDLHALSEEDEQKLGHWVMNRLRNFDVVIFEDYDKGVLNENLIQAIIEGAKWVGIPTVVDPKKKNFLAYKGASLFKPNLKEIKEGLKLDQPLNDQYSVERAVQSLQEILGAERIMVTLSERGVMITDFESWEHLPAHVRNISDVSGAGDTVVSVAALCLAQKAPLRDIAFLANLAGGLVCEKVGVVPIEKTKLLEEAIKLG